MRHNPKLEGDNMRCIWSKGELKEVCEVKVHYPSGQTLLCNGRHATCQGQVGKVWDIRDGVFQVPLPMEEQYERKSA